MGRIAFFLLLGIGLYVAYRVWRGGQRRNPGPRSAEPTAAGEAMVRCEHCGLNLPRSEALADDHRWYCSEAHRRLGRDVR